MAACASGSVKVVRAILEGGGDIDVVMLKSKVHAAHEAAQGGYLEVLMVLAAFGANFDQYDEKGNTPIHYAARNGHAMCCKYLSQRGKLKFLLSHWGIVVFVNTKKFDRNIIMFVKIVVCSITWYQVIIHSCTLLAVILLNWLSARHDNYDFGQLVLGQVVQGQVVLGQVVLG